MSHTPEKCDACGRRIRRTHHGIRLSDLATGQVIGRYHARPPCRESVIKYFESGALLRVSIVHPRTCGPEQENCDAAMGEAVA